MTLYLFSDRMIYHAALRVSLPVTSPRHAGIDL